MCTLTGSIALAACDNVGGFKRMKVTPRSNLLTWADASNVITITATSTSDIFEIEVPQDMIAAKSTQQDTRENNVLPVYDHEVTVTTQKNNAATRHFLNLLGSNEVVVFVKDNNDKWLVYGDLIRGLRTVVTGKDHKKPGDANGLDVNLKSTGNLKPEGEVASASVTSLALES
jgi:hypothetical protein